MVLLRRQADSPRLNGVYHEQLPGQPPHLEFRYRVQRLWQVPTETLLAGGLGVLPLALLGDVPEEALPEILRKVEERVTHDASPQRAEELWTALYVLCGLRLERAILDQIFQGVRLMSILEDSSAYELMQARILRKTLLRIGRKRFGPPDEATVKALDAILDPELLERMTERLLDVTTWSDLLTTT